MNRASRVGLKPDGAAPYCGYRYGPYHNWLRRWFWANTLVCGVFALLWLLLRSGAKPSRFAYPCQRAAFGTATAAFGVPLLAAILSTRRALCASLATRSGQLVAASGLLATVGFSAWALSPSPSAYVPGSKQPQPRADYRADVFVMDRALGPDGQHFKGLDDLILWMGLHGVDFYRSDSIENFETGPQGIVAADDVVVIKINYQWSERGGTNVDLLRGLIRRILDHPDAFSGEVVICENAQFASTSAFDRPENNAENIALSPHDVVVEFQGEGHTVSHYDWTLRRNILVNEYSDGDMSDGYIRYDYDPQIQGRVSYPKFQTDDGTFVSLKYGIWDPAGAAYDRDRLKFLNVPVLKSHHSTYGVTACVKNYMGVVTGALSTNSHFGIRYGILGALLGEIQLADLNILDAIWINADPYSGPATSYGGATRVDKLVAGLDPVAIDIWATKNILIPAFIANGYSPPWPYPSADPDDPGSEFRVYLDNSMSLILAAGYDATNDSARIDAAPWKGDYGVAGDVNGDGTINGADLQPFIEVVLGFDTDPLRILRSDLDADRNLDTDDVSYLVAELLAP